ncbi:hypothetical protein PALB_13430 [Pseudoalteromonas luteoviolacea B = ATCC 29581]|nr:hypothetical protein PALB_13430 [Pseudoalteromonas luteoviolacea B = ATCC 29581]
MRLDTASSSTGQFESRLLWASILLVVVLLLPSPASVKTTLIHLGFVATSESAKDKVTQLASSALSAPMKMLNANTNLPVFKLDVKYQDWLKIQEDRGNALRSGQIAEERAEVNATLYFNKEKFGAKIRLQGDMLDHVNAQNRWSLRVELKQKQAIFESRRFALISSNVRIHQGPALFGKTLEMAGFDIISPKTIPVRVNVNGDDWGVMLFEQAFSQDLLATNNRTEGLIARLDTFTQARASNGEIDRVIKPRVLQEKTILDDASLGKQRQIALTLLDDFFAGRKSASEVFIADKLGQYLAAVDMWGAWHALTWNNWRWYYNPHLAKLEPIQSDVAVTPAEHIWLMKSPSRTLLISKLMLEDPLVESHYQQALTTLQNLISSEHFLPELQEYETLFLEKLQSSSPLIAPYDFNIMVKQMTCLIDDYKTPPCDAVKPIPTTLHTNMASVNTIPNWDLVTHFQSLPGSNRSVLVIYNNDKVALNLKGITGITQFDEIDPLERVNADFPQVLPPGKRLNVDLPNSLVSVKLRAGLADSSMANYEFYKDLTANTFLPRPINANEAAEVLTKYPFIIENGNSWTIPAGNWQINEYVRTPDAWQVNIEPGSVIEFAPNSGLMVFGSLNAKGTAENTITFKAKDEKLGWSGVTVYGDNLTYPSYLEHALSMEAASPKLGLWQPRGATYFVQSLVNVDHFKVHHNNSEDAFNAINSVLNISNLTISDALSDAFDCDFCTGEIRDSRFINIGFRSGGDGIDVSGSEIKVTNTYYEKVRDKAISGGERSRLDVNNATFKEVNFGIVAKDDTTITASDVNAQSVKHNALMSYSKKRIFGPARMWIEGFNCDDPNCQNKLVAETGSVLQVNGELVQAQDLNVKNLYNTIMKSDKPK